MALKSPHSPPPPKRVGTYRIADRLGSGGMGEVFRAWDESLERWVAMKHILPRHVARETARERLLREAKTVARLSHPAIVQIHDLLQPEEGDVWIVMELVDGETLHRLIGQGKYTLGWILHVATQIAQGLAEAHHKAVIHRDLKTENIMVSEADEAKILDFGLAKQLGEGFEGPSLSQTGALPGTGRAMSPEQAMGELLDARTDLFSLGSLLYEALTGAAPFLGTSFVHSLSQVCTFHPPSVQAVNPAVPEPLSILVERLLEKDPGQRPQSAGEVARILSRIEDGLDSEKKRQVILATANRSLLESTAELSQSGFSGLSGWRESGALSRTTSFSRRGMRRKPTTGRRGLWLAFVVVATVLLGRLVYLNTPAESPGEAEPRIAVAVLPFQNLVPSVDIGLDLALAEMLAAELEVGNRFRVAHGEEVYVMQRDLDLPETATLADDTLWEIRRYLNVHFVFRGAYLVRDGEEIRVVARLQDAHSGQLLLSASETSSAEDWPEAIQGISHLFRERFTLEASDPQEHAALRAVYSQLPEQSEQAAALYDAGLRKLWSGRPYDAQRDFEESLEEVPDALLPLLAKSVAHQRLKETPEARLLIDQMIARPDLPEVLRKRMERRRALLTADPSARAERLAALWKETPDDLDLAAAFVESLLVLQQYADIEAALDRLRLLPDDLGEDPRVDLLEASLAAATGAQQRRMRALESAVAGARTRERRALLVESLLRSSAVHLERKEYERAEEFCLRAEAEVVEDEAFLERILSQRARIAIESGRREDARELYRQIQELSQEQLSTVEESVGDAAESPASDS